MTGSNTDTAREQIRKDSHVALDCGFAFALVVVGALAIIYLIGV